MRGSVTDSNNYLLIDRFNRASANIDGDAPNYSAASGALWSDVDPYPGTYPAATLAAGILRPAVYMGGLNPLMIDTGGHGKKFYASVILPSNNATFSMHIRSDGDPTTGSGWRIDFRRSSTSTVLENRLRRIDAGAITSLTAYGDTDLLVADNTKELALLVEIVSSTEIKFSVENSNVSAALGPEYQAGDFTYVGVSSTVSAGTTPMDIKDFRVAA